VPDARGWITRCSGTPLPAMPVEVNAQGLRDRARTYEKPADTARVVVLGGNVAEGLGVPEPAILARLLEDRADRRLGRRLDVVNAAVGGWSLDNDLLWFRTEGRRYAPDLVLVLLNPVVELLSIFPPPGVRVPAKPTFSLVDGQLVVHPATEPAASGEAARDGFLSHVALYRAALRIPTRVGAPVGWIEPEQGDAPAERVRGEMLARALLAALRDESAAAGARLVAVVTPAGYGGAAGDVLGAEEAMRTIVGDLGIPAIDLGPAFRWFREQTGRSGYVPGTARWNRDGHFIACQGIWTFLGNERLVPAGVVAAMAPGGGKLLEPRRFPEKLWRLRQSLFGVFVECGLVAVCVLWAGALLPPAGRDWLLVGVSLGMVAFLATPGFALAALVFALALYVAVEALPRDAVGTAVVVLLVALVVVPVMWAPEWAPRYEAAPHEYVAAATGFALLRFWAHAWDRRHGAPRRPLRQYLAAMFFFPTFLNGPIESTEDFVARRPGGALAPETPAELGRFVRTAAIGLARVAGGVLVAAVAMILLNKRTPDVFASGGAAVSRPRLWLWLFELGVGFYAAVGGLSEVAIGLGAMTGSRVGRNFDAPWAARGPREFWTRWYVSLARWLGRYVYRPLGGGRRHATLNVFVVFLASAAWFAWTAVKFLGAAVYPPWAWTGFLAWAVVNASVVALARRRRLRLPRARAVRAALTLAVLAVASIPFFLPPWSTLADCGRIALRLAWVR